MTARRVSSVWQAYYINNINSEIRSERRMAPSPPLPVSCGVSPAIAGLAHGTRLTSSNTKRALGARTRMQRTQPGGLRGDVSTLYVGR